MRPQIVERTAYGWPASHSGGSHDTRRPPPELASVATPEERALDALHRGNRDEALEEIMSAYGDHIYRYCRLMMRRPEDADDVLQITFMSAYKSFGSFRHRSSLRTWLFGIARHRCLDALRKRQKERNLVSHEDLTVDTIGTGAKEVELHVESKQLERRLARLSPKERSAVLLRHREGLAFKEIAAISGERPAAVERRVARAIGKLRRWAHEGKV